MNRDMLMAGLEHYSCSLPSHDPSQRAFVYTETIGPDHPVNQGGRHRGDKLRHSLMWYEVAAAALARIAGKVLVPAPSGHIGCWIANPWPEGLALFAPSTDPAEAWALIERWRLDRLTFEREDDGTWSCLALGRTAEVWYAVGTTKLIAAMRAYVASKLGEKVELP